MEHRAWRKKTPPRTLGGSGFRPTTTPSGEVHRPACRQAGLPAGRQVTQIRELKFHRLKNSRVFPLSAGRHFQAAGISLKFSVPSVTSVVQFPPLHVLHGRTTITQIREESTDLPAGRQVSQIGGLKFHRLKNSRVFPLSAGRHFQAAGISLKFSVSSVTSVFNSLPSSCSSW